MQEVRLRLVVRTKPDFQRSLRGSYEGGHDVLDAFLRQLLGDSEFVVVSDSRGSPDVVGPATSCRSSR